MKVWTYAEMSQEVLSANDLQDETFISPNELAGYFNEALSECATEIHDLNKDYFLTKYFVPCVTGTGVYTLPDSIFATKIRRLIYTNGALIYEMRRYRGEFIFQDMAFTDQYGQADDYRYILTNHVPGQASLEVHPVARETAILPPASGSFTPWQLWYLRNVSRIPKVAYNGLAAELCNPELIAPAQINTGTNIITSYAGTATMGIPQQGVPGGYPGSIAYVTGDICQVSAGPGGTLPSPLKASTNYYIIQTGSGAIQLATTLANALATTPITITTTGTVYMILKVGATTAIQLATLIDIPEFATFIMQWVKCRSMSKEDPRLEGEIALLSQQKSEMVDGLTNAVPDNDDCIVPDFSSYTEMS